MLRTTTIALVGLLYVTPLVATAAPIVRPIDGFSDEVNARLEAFLIETEGITERKVAVFDGDGTVLGQTPHYLADECMYMHAQQHPDRKRELLARMGAIRNVSMEYVSGRVRYLAGLGVEDVQQMGRQCFADLYADKIFAPSRDLIALLQENGFEVWVITGSPQVLYQGFLSEQLGIPMTNVVGVHSIIRDGVITDELVQPVPQDHGKTEAIETVVQTCPLLVAGNSRGDKEMIEHSCGLRLIVNPDEHVAPDQEMSIADYASSQGWLVVRVRDVPAPGFPSLSSGEFGIRINKTRDVAPTDATESARVASPPDVQVTVEQASRLRVTRKGMRGAVRVTVANTGDSDVEIEVPEVHGLVFEVAETGELHVVVHPCQCVMNVKQPESAGRVVLGPGEQHGLALDDFGCSGVAWHTPPKGEYRMTYRVHTVPPANGFELQVPADCSVHEITAWCRALYTSASYWEGAFASDPITIRLKK